ncbi:MAG TPA: hypothetical protein VJU77_16725 [Chthoniobacterales bacterium]|nr:hypothetical protein [Chthoniobacterales bacterium]
MSFLREEGESLVIFVLKGEVLSYKNWISESFDGDLRRAAAVDLSAAGLEKVKRVEIILAYNKDQEDAGVASFEKTSSALGTKVGDHATLTFTRWNLVEITELVRQHLLTPSLVPQNLFGQFSYLCAQAGDFIHGSDEWVNQLVPNWRRFLSRLTEPIDLRMLRLIPVTLVILRSYAREPTRETGWLDLAEWGVLAAWRCAQKSDDPEVHKVVQEMWAEFYLRELERFYSDNAAVATVEHGLQAEKSTTNLDSVAGSYLAFWHLGRLGILTWALVELSGKAPTEERAAFRPRLTAVIDVLNGLVSNNSGALRPMLDIQHIELFLVWRAQWISKQSDNIEGWLWMLGERILMRRLGKSGPPFISGANSWELAFERAGGKSERAFGDTSSNLLLMLLELCCSLPAAKHAELLRHYFLRLILAADDDGKPLGDRQPMQLMSWAPPPEWENRILEEAVLDGVAIPAEFVPDSALPDLGLPAQLASFAYAARQRFPLQLGERVPSSVFALACLKHQSPIPPEFWRSLFLRVNTSN